MRSKTVHDCDIEKAALDKAMAQMSVWNTWNPDLLHKIIEEKDPAKKMAIASKTINS